MAQPMTSDRDTLREAVARIVCPEAFVTLREIAAAAGLDADRPPPGAIIMQDIDAPIANRAPQREAAFVKADAILALIPLFEVEEVLGRLVIGYGRDHTSKFCRDQALALLSKLKAIRGEVSDA